MQKSQVQEKNEPLDLSVRFFKGVGPERSRLLERLGIVSFDDLMHLFPRVYEDRRERVRIRDLKPGAKQLICAVITQKKLIRLRQGRIIFRLRVKDQSGALDLIWFQSPYLENVFAEGQTVNFFGKPEFYGKEMQMVHPDYEICDPSGKRVHTERIVPIYPLTQDLYQRTLRSLQYELLVKHLRDVQDPIPSDIRDRQKLVNKIFAMKCVHFPQSLDEMRNAYRRLVFEEFLVIQLRMRLRRRKALPIKATCDFEQALDTYQSYLDFDLTKGQIKSMRDMISDFKHGVMQRLLQGDVGSGKTVVATFLLYVRACMGRQGALMVPTEILAQQHYLTLSRILAQAGIAVGLLTQGCSPDERQRTLKSIASGELLIVVGTHALIQAHVKFKRLGAVVIDEQHKFGVHQREFLQRRAKHADLLVMSATPIPRTLSMTIYGDLDISNMLDHPKKKKIETMWVDESRREYIYTLLRQEIQNGRQAYIVTPLLKQGPLMRKDAQQVQAELQRTFKEFGVGLLHGQMAAQAKQTIMNAFKQNKIQILVATTVIEVGIDVPNATLMLIENAECFGLSQLHQLRGRIGRGKRESLCVLMSNTQNAQAAERLHTFTQLQSGFDVAEEDLRLRGPGDFLGQKQHGVPPIRIGDLVKDASLLEAARCEARALLAQDPDLLATQHVVLRRTLQKRFTKHAHS